MDLAPRRAAPLLLLVSCAVAAVASLGTGLDVGPAPAAASPPAEARPEKKAGASRVVDVATAPVASAPPAEVASSAPLVGEGVVVAEGVVFEGVVVDTDGQPIPDAEVGDVSGPPTRSSRLGTFRLERARPAELSIQANGFLPSRLHVGPRLDVRVVLVRPGVLRGVVRDPRGPVAGAPVFADRTYFSGPGARFEVVSDPVGRFAFEALPPGVWEVGALLPGERREARSRSVRIRSGVPIEVELDLHEVGDRPAVIVCPADGAPGRPSPYFDLLVAGERYQRGWPPTAPLDVELEVRAVSGALQGSARAPAGARQVRIPLEPSRRLMGRVLRATSPRDVQTDPHEDRWAKLDRLDLVLRPDEAGPRVPAQGSYPAYAVLRLEPGVETFAFEVPVARGGTLEVHSRHEVVLRRRVEVGETDLVVPVPGMCALYGSAARGEEAYASSDGLEFRRLSSLFAGGRAFVVTVREAEGLAGAGWVDLRPGEPVRAALDLAPAARLRGRVVDGAGHGLWTSVAVAGQRIRTQPDGRFELLLPPGRFHLVAASHPLDVEAWTGRPGARPTERQVDVPGPGDVDLGDLVVEVE